MKKPKDVKVYCTNESKQVQAKYNYLYINNPELHFSGPWAKYTDAYRSTTSDSAAKITAKQYSYPYFPTGIMQVVNNEAAFGFISKAEAFALNYHTSTAGASVKVYVDNIETDTISTKAADQCINNLSKWVALPNDGKEHKIILIVDKPSSEKYVFTLGSVIERNAK